MYPAKGLLPKKRKIKTVYHTPLQHLSVRCSSVCYACSCFGLICNKFFLHELMFSFCGKFFSLLTADQVCTAEHCSSAASTAEYLFGSRNSCKLVKANVFEIQYSGDWVAKLNVVMLTVENVFEVLFLH